MEEIAAARIVEQAPDALLVLDAKGRVRSWNPAAERVFGLSAAQAEGRPLSALIGAAVAPLLAAGQSVAHRALVANRADGTRLYVLLSLAAQHDAAGQPDGFVCVLADATAARVAQDHETVQSRYRDLFESLPDAIVIVNDSGRIVHVNAQAVDLFGHAAEAVIGEPVEVLLPPRLRVQHVPQRSAYLQAPGLRPMGRGLALHGLHADGHEFPVEISLGPIDMEGRRMVISAIRDISDRKAIEHALQQKNLELERANRAKDHFLATMSHELRTPLNAILGFTGLMLMKLPGPLTETQERHLSHVQTSGKHLLSLINDLLDLAKIESGHVELVCSAVEARPVIEEVVTALRPAAYAKQLQLELELPDGTLPVLADRRALHQVVLNLTGNAIKFTALGRVCLRVEQEDRQWTLSVSDTGIGIEPEDQARLFQAFVQVGDWRTRRGEGTGLGLHLSRKLVELMGGTLSVQSTPGAGSCFTVQLARAD
jgi:protein-histidine pros-kinase